MRRRTKRIDRYLLSGSGKIRGRALRLRGKRMTALLNKKGFYFTRVGPETKWRHGVKILQYKNAQGRIVKIQKVGSDLWEIVK